MGEHSNNFNLRPIAQILSHPSSLVVVIIHNDHADPHDDRTAIR